MPRKHDMPNYVINAKFATFRSLSDQFWNISLQDIETVKPYIGWKQVAQFFKSGLTRNLKAAIVMDKHRKRMLLRMTVHPRGSKSLTHDVIVVLNGNAVNMTVVMGIATVPWGMYKCILLISVCYRRVKLGLEYY